MRRLPASLTSLLSPPLTPMLSPTLGIGSGLTVSRGESDLRDVHDARVIAPPTAKALLDRGLLALIATGLGGHDLGGIAAHLTAEVIVRRFALAVGDPRDTLPRAMHAAERAVRETAERHAALQRARSGCATLVIRGTLAYCATIGDSRVYLARGGELFQLSHDAVALALPEHAVPLAVRDGDRFLLCSRDVYATQSEAQLLFQLAAPEPQASCDRLVTSARAMSGDNDLAAVIVGIGRSTSQGEGRVPVRV